MYSLQEQIKDYSRPVSPGGFLEKRCQVKFCKILQNLQENTSGRLLLVFQWKV